MAIFRAGNEEKEVDPVNFAAFEAAGWVQDEPSKKEKPEKSDD